MSETLTLPAVQAHHWGLRTIYRAAVPLVPFNEVAEVWVEAEVPRDVHGAEVAKRGNRYYPSTVHLAIDESMSPAAARAVARALLIAADVCDSHDVEDTDVCGHWAPCECPAQKGGIDG